MTTGKIRALIRWTFVCKVMSLLFNTLSRLVIAFLPRSVFLYKTTNGRWFSFDHWFRKLLACFCCLVTSHIQLFCDPMEWGRAPLSREFPKQEYWSGLPFPSPGVLPSPGIKPRSRVAGRFFTDSHQGGISYLDLSFLALSYQPVCLCPSCLHPSPRPSGVLYPWLVPPAHALYCNPWDVQTWTPLLLYSLDTPPPPLIP